MRYCYAAHVLRVKDGDTMWLEVDQGLDHASRLTVRLLGIDTPEKAEPRWAEAGVFVRAWVLEHGETRQDPLTGFQVWVALQTVKDRREKYGRYLGVVRPWDTYGEPGSLAGSLNQALLDAGLAVPYTGRN